MDLETSYREIRRRIDRLDFDRLWPGFHDMHFAVYDAEVCCLDGKMLPRPESFCANTAVRFEGRYLAVWRLDREPEDMDLLAAKLVHEMFHAYQMTCGESRFPDEMAALRQYRYHPENLSGKLAEARLLASALTQNAPEDFSRFLRLRKARLSRFPAECTYESQIEQIEGSATYVELCALGAMCPDRKAQLWRQLLSRIQAPEAYLPVRVVSYDVGAAILACLQRFSGTDFAADSQVPFSVAMLEGVPPARSYPSTSDQIVSLVRDYGQRTDEILASARRKNRCVLEGCYPLVCVNIWDARRSGNAIVSNGFVSYRDPETTRTLSGDFVLETDGQGNILRVLRQ